MSPSDLVNLEWLDPWFPSSPGLENELKKEIGGSHPLFGQEAISIGRRGDCDDVLFLLPKNSQPLAVVHLTWNETTEQSLEWPQTTFYSSLDDWIERCMKRDHLEFTIS